MTFPVDSLTQCAMLPVNLGKPDPHLLSARDGRHQTHPLSVFQSS